MTTNGAHPTCTTPGCGGVALDPDGGECYQCLANVHLLGRFAIRDPVGPPFPIDVYPKPLRCMAEAFAANFPCPVEWVAVPMLAVCGSAIGNSRAARVSSSYLVGPRVWTVVIAAAGSGKSPALEAAMAPVVAHAKREMRAWLSAVRDAEEAKEPIPAPPPERWTTDTTVEALGRLLVANPRGVLCSHDELSGFIGGMNQYKPRGHGSDRQKWLELWAGAAFRISRVKEGPLFCPNPVVNIAGCVVTSKLPIVLSGEDDGFSDRFLLSHAEPGPYEPRGPDIPVDVTSAYADLYDELSTLQPAFPTDVFPAPALVGLTDEAQRALEAAESDLMRECDVGAQREFQRSAWSKFRGCLTRLALIVALANRHERVEVDDVDAGVALVDYFKGQLLGLSDVVSSTFRSRDREMLSYAAVVAYLARKGPRTVRELVTVHVPFCQSVASATIVLEAALRDGLVVQEGKMWLAR